MSWFGEYVILYINQKSVFFIIRYIALLMRGCVITCNEKLWVQLPILAQFQIVRKESLIEAEGRIYASVVRPSLVHIMAWRRIGDKPLSEPTISRLNTMRTHFELKHNKHISMNFIRNLNAFIIIMSVHIRDTIHLRRLFPEPILTHSLINLMFN